MNNNKGFTLSEMLIVLLIISSLMFLIVPNLADTMKSAEEKSCATYIELVQSQMEAYRLETGADAATMDELVTAGYVKSNACPNGAALTINAGIVEVVTEPTTQTP